SAEPLAHLHRWVFEAAERRAVHEETHHAGLGLDLPDRRADCRGSWLRRDGGFFDGNRQDHLLRRGVAVPDLRARRNLPRAHTDSPVAATLSEQLNRLA